MKTAAISQHGGGVEGRGGWTSFVLTFLFCVFVLALNAFESRQWRWELRSWFVCLFVPGRAAGARFVDSADAPLQRGPRWCSNNNHTYKLMLTGNILIGAIRHKVRVGCFHKSLRIQYSPQSVHAHEMPCFFFLTDNNCFMASIDRYLSHAIWISIPANGLTYFFFYILLCTMLYCFRQRGGNGLLSDVPL